MHLGKSKYDTNFLYWLIQLLDLPKHVFSFDCKHKHVKAASFGFLICKLWEWLSSSPVQAVWIPCVCTRAYVKVQSMLYPYHPCVSVRFVPFHCKPSKVSKVSSLVIIWQHLSL